MLCNYHTHTTFCDGKEPVSDFVEKAVKLRFDHLGFSAHAPIPDDNDFAIKEKDIPLYLNEIRHFRKTESKVAIYAGLECDFIPERTENFSCYKEKYSLDFIIGGIHLVKRQNGDDIWFIDGSKREIYDRGIADFFDGNIQKAVARFWEQSFEMIETQKFDIIAHLDKIKMHNQNRFFTQTEPWYRKLVQKALDLIKEHDIIVEINSRGLYKNRCDEFYPSDFILKKMAEKDIPCLFSSDAHKSAELMLFYSEALSKLKENGICKLHCLENGSWKEYGI